MAAVAVPKFVDLQQDAHAAHADAAFAAARSAASMHFAKGLINTPAAADQITADAAGATNLLDLMDVDLTLWAVSGSTIEADLGTVTYVITISAAEDYTSSPPVAATLALAP